MSHVEFELSDIGEGLEEAEIIQWLVAVGDTVSRDQPIVEVMTDKSNAELPAPVAGTIVSVGGDVGAIVRVGETLAVIDPAANETNVTAPSVPQPDVLAAPTPHVSTFQQAAQPPPLDPSSPPPRPKASPATRLEAARLGVDLTTVPGSGPGGRILLSDLGVTDSRPATMAPAVEVAAPSQTAAEPPVAPVSPTVAKTSAPPARIASAPSSEPLAPGTVALRGVRRAIAHNMHRSWSQIPHIHSFEHIDAEPLLALRAQLRESGRPGFESITPLSLMVAAVSGAMAEYPQANASLDLDAETITQHPAINVGFAVAAPQGLVVPVLKDAGALSLAAIVSEVRRLVDGARTGTLERSEFAGGTVTITNFGSLGGEQALPLIRPPESVIFGFGSIAARPFVIDDQVVARKTMNIVLGADHRLLDGDVATGLITHVARALTTPINLALGT